MDIDFILFWLSGLAYSFLTLGLVVTILDAFPSLKSYLPWNQLPRPRGKVSHSYRTDPRNRHLQHQLLGMLQGDTATAKRLLKQQRRNHPGRSDNWYLEKVIYDLERDRRR